METVEEIEFRRSLDREKHRQTRTTLEKEAQLTSGRDRHKQTRTALTDIERSPAII